MEYDIKAPGIDIWPGDFDSPPQLVKADVEITSYQHDLFATGYYLPGGQEATIRVNTYIIFRCKLLKIHWSRGGQTIKNI